MRLEVHAASGGEPADAREYVEACGVTTVASSAPTCFGVAQLLAQPRPPALRAALLEAVLHGSPVCLRLLIALPVFDAAPGAAERHVGLDGASRTADLARSRGEVEAMLTAAYDRAARGWWPVLKQGDPLALGRERTDAPPAEDTP